MWCAALSRRVVNAYGVRGRLPEVMRSTEEAGAPLADLAAAHERLETEMHERVTELEERLDFAERLLADMRSRSSIDGSK